MTNISQPVFFNSELEYESIKFSVSSKVTLISNDKFTTSILASLLKPIVENYQSDVVIYIFSEENIGQFLSSFCDVFIGGYSIILVDKKYKHFLTSSFLKMTADVFSLDMPVEKLISSIDHSLKSKKMCCHRTHNDNLLNLISILYHLNECEKDVLSMVIDGESQTTISQKLHIAPRLVSRYKISAMSKMGMTTLAEINTFLKMYVVLVQRQKDYLFEFLSDVSVGN